MTTPSKSARVQLILLAILFLGPLLLAAYFYLQRDAWEFDSIERGHLLDPPYQLATIELTKSVGGKPVTKDFEGKWIMLYVAPEVCQLDCNRNLYNMRQARLALGKEMERVIRVVVDTIPPMGTHLKNLLTKVHTDIEVFYTKAYAKTLKPGYLYIVDPIGNIILEYPPEVRAKDLLNDTKRLLKVSQIG